MSGATFAAPGRGDPELQQRKIVIFEEEITRVSCIIQEMLAFSRPIHPDQTVEVNTVLRGLRNMLEYSLHDKQVALIMDLEPTLPLVHLSADHLFQVILNLVRNAEDAMPTRGQPEHPLSTGEDCQHEETRKGSCL
jgi:nitrogen-specific signal transduction histidine kinase